MPLKKSTSVQKGTKKNGMKTLVEGEPNDHSRKHELPTNVVGASLGITKNMDNYESLRVDVWGTEDVKSGETKEEAFHRLFGELDKELTAVVQSYTED